MQILILAAVAISIVLSLVLGKRVDISSILASFKADKNKELENVKNSTKIEELATKESAIKKEIKAEKDPTVDEMLKYFNKK